MAMAVSARKEDFSYTVEASKVRIGPLEDQTRDDDENKKYYPEVSTDYVRIQAVSAIERWWQSVKDKRVFSMLKYAICASEYSLTQEIIRKVTPAEAELLGDPAIEAKIKFRFGGEEFPPCVLFKIFMSMNTLKRGGGGGVKYISGRRMVRPASKAADDARRQMGNRKYFDQMLEDACQHQQLKVTDEVDVTSMKDYMQYVSSVDERPAYLGGKENTWRLLNLKVLPRFNCLHGLIGESRVLRKSSSLSQLDRRSPTQQRQIKVTTTSLSHQHSSSHDHESRGSSRLRKSRNATKKRAEKMRKLYSEGEEVEEGKEEEEWEQDVEDLYQWAQTLSFDDIR